MITICPRSRVRPELRRGVFRAVLSISDTNEKVPYPVLAARGVKVLALHFDDVEQEGQELYGFYRAAEEDIERIVDFAGLIEGYDLLIHCGAGVSRSSAAAMIVAQEWGEDPAGVLQPGHWPNAWMLRLYDRSRDGFLEKLSEDWKARAKESS